MQKRKLGNSGLEIAPLVFGGNVFGWTADEPTTFGLIDRFVAAGFSAIDTADVYSAWIPGHKGGESETVIGNWLKANPGRRGEVVIFTKTGMPMGDLKGGLKKAHIEAAVDASLKRLNTDYIDLFFSHKSDPETPIEETLSAYDGLIRAGKIRAVGASNYSADELADALAASARDGLPRYEVLQPEYSLMVRDKFEGPMRDLVQTQGVGVVTYFSLASGFLAGKYRSKADLEGRARGGLVGQYLNERGLRILAALDDVAAAHGAAQASVALAWLMAQPGVTAPIASATSADQLDMLMAAADLNLSADELASLTAASAGG